MGDCDYDEIQQLLQERKVVNMREIFVGDQVTLDDDDDEIIPAGTYIVSQVNDDGSFHVGGNTAVWPHRILSILSKG